jgi:hypothetical protein
MTDDQVTLCINIDCSDIYDILESTGDETGLVDMKKCCFKKNGYIFQFENNDILQETGLLTGRPGEKEELVILKTVKQNYVVVNKNLLGLLDYFDGKTNLESLSKGAAKSKAEFLIAPLNSSMEIKTFHPSERITDFFGLVKVLYRSHLIHLQDYSWEETEPFIRLDKGETGKAVLLLGDTTGTATTGLLYLASYLRRNGIEAYCQWNDPHKTAAALETNVKKILSRLRPGIVGISMKWFPHIARALEICRIVKKNDPHIKVVVGGDTASFFWEHIIRCEYIDYVVLGDGEVPLLKICLGQDNIPNCVYKKEGNIVKGDIGYVQDEKNSREIFLSHLDEIFVSAIDPFLAQYVYIYTGKGCSQQCFYCAGCGNVQKKTFNRAKPFIREVTEARQDIMAVKKYTAAFMFDFDMPADGFFSYYRGLWEGIDLSRHFCLFFLWKIPGQELIELLVNTFKYVYFFIDLVSLSETHRLKLYSLGIVKPQPTDGDIFSFMEGCEKYENIEVVLTSIVGTPYFSTDDFEKSEEFLCKLLDNYSCFQGLEWLQLHAQPGAPVTENPDSYALDSCARTYSDFLEFSQLNLKNEFYSEQTINYPVIYCKDDRLNSRFSEFYSKINNRLEKTLETRRKSLQMTRRVNCGELEEKMNRTAQALKETGITSPEMAEILKIPGNSVKVLDLVNTSYGRLDPVKRLVELIIGFPEEDKGFVAARDMQPDDGDFTFDQL